MYDGGRPAPLAGDSLYNKGSGRACTQLTSLLSSVQASLAELKVEVSSAQSELGKSRCQIHNKLSLDATLQKSIPSSGTINHTHLQTAQLLKSGFSSKLQPESPTSRLQPGSPAIGAGSISSADAFASHHLAHSGNLTTSHSFSDTEKFQLTRQPGAGPRLHVDAAQVVLHSSQHSVAALIDRIVALERSAEHRTDGDSQQLAIRMSALEEDVQSKQLLIQQLQGSNRSLEEQLEEQRCAMLYIADDVKACGAELQQLQDAGGESAASQHTLSDVWAQIRSVQQQGQEHESELRCVRDELVDSMSDRLNRLQNTVAELQLPKCAIPTAPSSFTAREATALQREVEECKCEIRVVRDLVDAAASKHTVSQAVEKMSTQIASMNANVEAVCQQLYALKTSEMHELVQAEMQARLTDTMSQVRVDMASLSKDLSAETQALGGQLSSAFSAIGELEAGSFSATEDHHVLMEVHTSMQSMQNSVQNLHVQLQEVAAVQSSPQEKLIDSSAHERVAKIDVELAELHATVKQVAASSTLLRGQFMELSGTQSNHADTVDYGTMQADLAQLGSSIQELQKGLGSLQQSHSMHEQVVGDVSVRVDSLGSSLAHAGAVAQAEDSRSVLVDSAMQELRCTVDTLQQGVENLSTSVPADSVAKVQTVTSELLSEMRAQLALQAERIAALEQAGSNHELSILKQLVHDTEANLKVVLEKMESIEDARQGQLAAEKPLHESNNRSDCSLLRQSSERSDRADTLESLVEAVEATAGVAAEDIRTCMDANRSVAGDVLELESRIATIEAAQIETTKRHSLEELQNAVMLLADSVDGKADRAQVMCLEEKLGPEQVAEAGQPASAEDFVVVSDKLEQIACELARSVEKAEDAAVAVITLSSDVQAVSQQVVCIQERLHGDTECNTRLQDEVTDLSYKLETLSDEFEASETTAAEKTVAGPTSDPLVQNPEQLAELRQCLGDQQAQLVAQTERVIQLEQQQQIGQDAQAQQVAETTKAMAAIDDVGGRLVVIEHASEKELQVSVEGPRKEALEEVQQALLAVKADVESVHTLSNSTMELQSKYLQDIADLSLQMEQIKGRLEEPEPTAGVESSAETLQERMHELATDIESYQKRSENVQNSSNVKLRELTDAVAALRELVGEHVEKLAAMEAESESRGAAASSQASEQKAHVENALQLMEVQLSALSEVIGNTKAESAELREIMSAGRNTSSQIQEDMFTDKLALEERLEAVEERLGGMDLIQLQQNLQAVPVQEDTANLTVEQTLQSPMLEKEDAGSSAGVAKCTDDLHQLQEQLGARIDYLDDRVQDVAQQAAALSGEIGVTSTSCQNLREGMKLMQNAFLEMQEDSAHQTLSLPAAQELSLRVSALHEQFENMKSSFKPLVEKNSDAQACTAQAGVVVEAVAAQEATSDAFEAFKAACSDRSTEAIGMTQLEEMKAEIESEIQSIRSCILQGGPTDLEDRVASLERCLGTTSSRAPQQQTGDRLLASRPMVLMQLVEQQDVASSITIESVTPEVNMQPADAASALLPAGSPHSSLSSVGADLRTDTKGFTLFRTNDLFYSEAQAANSCERTTPQDVFCSETQVANCEQPPPQSHLVWQENPEFTGQAMGSSVMCPQADGTSDTENVASQEQTVPCLDTEPEASFICPELDSDCDQSSQASYSEEPAVERAIGE